MWISLSVEYHAVPLTGLPFVIDGASYPRSLVQGSVFEVEKIAALGPPVLIPNNMGCTLRSDGQRASVFNQSRLRVNLLNIPPMIFERSVFQYPGRKANMWIP